MTSNSFEKCPNCSFTNMECYYNSAYGLTRNCPQCKYHYCWQYITNDEGILIPALKGDKYMVKYGQRFKIERQEIFPESEPDNTEHDDGPVTNCNSHDENNKEFENEEHERLIGLLQSVEEYVHIENISVEEFIEIQGGVHCRECKCDDCLKETLSFQTKQTRLFDIGDDTYFKVLDPLILQQDDYIDKSVNYDGAILNIISIKNNICTIESHDDKISIPVLLGQNQNGFLEIELTVSEPNIYDFDKLIFSYFNYCGLTRNSYIIQCDQLSNLFLISAESINPNVDDCGYYQSEPTKSAFNLINNCSVKVTLDMSKLSDAIEVYFNNTENISLDFETVEEERYGEKYISNKINVVAGDDNGGDGVVVLANDDDVPANDADGLPF